MQWRGEVDKEGNHHVTPLTPTALEVLGCARDRAHALGDAPVFSEERAWAGKPADRQRTRKRSTKWWARAEKLSELPHVRGMGWHSLRRKFATELKHIPLTDLCELGGWKTAQTILMCYQQPMRRGLLNRRCVEEAPTTPPADSPSRSSNWRAQLESSAA